MAKKESYEETLAKLQNILTILEEKELNLDDSMKAYEDGVKLINKLYKTLDSLEGKLIVVKESKEVEFEGENEVR
ncbi:exodeoxyribonuclease VII small subunit [Clostridium sp. SHJSY1]|uniref:exodeoxyribonuclease VII small subunit n=1 Tax=Clostridium sp. SHJSY1 TaxID=2942483 RepID=UPI0028745DE1|nr:exodeoxyribonuclease VII small subunit [Clostridium sp. SHJSY1]MDS0527872.1 exodeoxyribonuclease VII small subunit [Clostridium sp. SHJSY1]